MFEWILVLVINHNGWQEQLTYNEVFTTQSACSFRLEQIRFRTLTDIKIDLVMGECIEHMRQEY